MRITGLPERINEQLAIIPDVQMYFQELAANPTYVKTGELDHLLGGITDERLREVIFHIGKHNKLPDTYDSRRVINGELAEIYRNSTEYGSAVLRFLMGVVKAQFMPDTHPSVLGYRRQVALVCKKCGEYKASGMFEFASKDMSYTREISFGREHLLDPERTAIRSFKKHGKSYRNRVVCVPCNTYQPKDFEKRHEGSHASAREYFYLSEYLSYLRETGHELPNVLSVRVRTKEDANTAEKMAYILSGRSPDGSKHFKVLEENRAELEEKLGKDTLDRLIQTAIHDRFGIRLIAPTQEGCYSLRDWFKSHYPVVREIDYINSPKANGYQSLHLTLMGLPSDHFTAPERIAIDVQIRTREMNDVAERGSAAWGVKKQRDDLLDHKLFLAITAFRHYLFG